MIHLIVIIDLDVKSPIENGHYPILIFFVFSTIIYALVFATASARGLDWFKPLADSFALAIILGSVLQPLNHVLLLGGRIKDGLVTSLLLIIAYNAVWLSSAGFDKLDLDALAVLVFVWQGLYLVRFYWGRICPDVTHRR